jgi:hypothetical protein
MLEEDFLKSDFYIVYEIFLDGSKSIYGTDLDKNFILRKRQLKTVLSHLKRKGIKFEVFKVDVIIREKIEV